MHRVRALHVRVSLVVRVDRKYHHGMPRKRGLSNFHFAFMIRNPGGQEKSDPYAMDFMPLLDSWIP